MSIHHVFRESPRARHDALRYALVSGMNDTDKIQNVTTPTKCECQHCHEHIEFDRADFEEMEVTTDKILGQIIACPHCEADTTLYLERARVGSSQLEPPKLKPVNRRKHRIIWAVILGVGIAAALLIWFIATMNLNPDKVEGSIGLTLTVVIAGLVFLWAVLWILFPVFVFFGMTRMETLLRQIERNTRRE